MAAPDYPHPLIAREGWAFLASAVVFALVLSWAGLWVGAALAWLAVLFIAQFFRDPPRRVPAEANAVLSPADGKVMLVAHAHDPYLDREALKISVFMNVFNVHVYLPGDATPRVAVGDAVQATTTIVAVLA